MGVQNDKLDVKKALCVTSVAIRELQENHIPKNPPFFKERGFYFPAITLITMTFS
jgi:hypothetical protein